jgi:hypothetical protein
MLNLNCSMSGATGLTQHPYAPMVLNHGRKYPQREMAQIQRLAGAAALKPASSRKGVNTKLVAAFGGESSPSRANLSA